MKNKYIENEYLSLALFFLVFIVYAVVYMTKNCYSAAMVYLVEENVLTKSQTGIINSAFYLAYGPFQIVGGMAVDRHSPYKLLGVGLLGAAICNLLILFVQNFYIILLIWALNGAIQFGIWPGVFKIVSGCLAPTHRYNAVFYISFASTSGLIISYIVAGMVSGWRANFVVASVSLVIAFVVWTALGNWFDKKMVPEEGLSHGASHLPEYKKNEKQKTENFGRTILTSGLAILLPVCAIQSVFSLGTQTFVPTMIRESYTGISSSLASILAIVPIVAGLLGKMLVQRIYKNKIYNEAMTLFIVISAMIPFMLLTFLIGKINVIFIIGVMSVVIMLANTASVVNNPYMATRFIKMGRNGTVSGIVNAMSSFGIVAANIVTPLIAENAGWSAVIVSWIVFGVAAIVLSLAAYIPWKRFVDSIER